MSKGVIDTPVMVEDTTNVEYVESVKNAPTFGLKDKLGYMFGDLGFNSLQVLVNTYIMIFLVNLIGIRPIHFSIIIAVGKAFDAINDPFIGRAVDNKPGTKNGKYKQFILMFLVPYVITTILLFVNIGALPYWAKISYALVTYIIWAVFGTFINVPYGAMLNSISSDLNHRASLSNFRSVGSTLANVVVTSIAPLLIFDSNSNPIGSRFILLSVILGVFTAVCLILTHILVSERIIVPDKTEEEMQNVNYLEFLKSFTNNRPMIAVVSAYIIAKFFIQTTGITNQYVFMSYYNNTNQLAAIGLGTLIPTVLGMLMVQPLTKRFGKRSLLVSSSFMAAIVFGINAFFPVSSTGYIVIQLLGMFFIGFFNLLVWSLIADAVDYQTWITHERNDGTIYAIITFLVFLVSSLSTSLIAVLLEWIGYDPALGAQQGMEIATRVKVLGGILPAIGAILISLSFGAIYNISDDEMQKISQEVNERYSAD